MPQSNPPSADYGVHSEVGKLRKVLVCRCSRSPSATW
jgi:arginine deiminase